MTCSSCSTAVEQALLAEAGVLELSVALLSGRAEASPVGGNFIQELPALDCTLSFLYLSCQNSLFRHEAEQLSPILHFHFPDAEGMSALWILNYFMLAQVVYNAAEIGPRKIKTLIEDLGYTAELVAADNLSAGLDERGREVSFWKRKFWIGFVFSLPVFLLAMVFEHTPRTKEGLETNVGGFTVGVIVKWVLTTPVLVISPSPF